MHFPLLRPDFKFRYLLGWNLGKSEKVSEPHLLHLCLNLEHTHLLPEWISEHLLRVKPNNSPFLQNWGGGGGGRVILFMESLVQNIKAREANGLATALGGGPNGNKLRKREILEKMDLEVSKPNSIPTFFCSDQLSLRAVTNTWCLELSALTQFSQIPKNMFLLSPNIKRSSGKKTAKIEIKASGEERVTLRVCL